jgi:two-component system, LytTR family, sensor kinase
MKKIKWHIVGILIYTVWTISIDLFAYGNKIKFWLEFNVLFTQFFIFYTVFATLYFLFLRSKKMIALLFFISSLVGTYVITLFYFLLRDYFYQKTQIPENSVLIHRASQFYTNIFIISVGYFFFYRFIHKQTENKLLLEKNLNLQKSLLQSENDFLRAQINPHFLYNSLNYFYAETFEALPKVGDSIMALSDIMRYSLTDFTATNGLANLNEEIQNIQNIIGINKSRFNDILYVQLMVHGNVEGKKITPMMFITLVENLFKHGDLQDANCPAFITCTIDENTKQVIFITSNKKSGVKNIIPGGLGTSNIKKRLELLYKDGFTLNFEEEITLYKATLVIPYFVA